VGVEPTGDRIACRPPVLKTGTITGPHALPWNCGEKAMDDEVADPSPLQRSADRAIHGCSFRRLETTGLKAKKNMAPERGLQSRSSTANHLECVPERCSAAFFHLHCSKALFHASSAAPFQGTPARRCSTLYLLRLRNDAQVGFGGLPSAGILSLGFFVRNVAADDDVITRLPVRWRGNFVLCR